MGIKRRVGAVLARGSRVYLRRPQRADCAAFLDMVSASRELHEPWVKPPQDEAGFRSYLARVALENQCGFLVYRCADHALVGVVNLSEIVGGAFKSAYLGYYADARFAGVGLMSQAMRLVIGHAFGNLGLHRLEANVQPDNHSSIALVRGCGFRREGYSPRYLYIDGAWRDHERWAITAEEV